VKNINYEAPHHTVFFSLVLRSGKTRVSEWNSSKHLYFQFILILYRKPHIKPTEGEFMNIIISSVNQTESILQLSTEFAD